jgi:hypothetical protein
MHVDELNQGRRWVVKMRLRSLRRGSGTVLGALAIMLAAPAVASAATVPSAPRALTGTAGKPVGRVSLSWTVPLDTGGGIDTYLYAVATDYDPVAHTGTWSAPVNLKRATTVAALPCAAVYPAVCTYRISAHNSAGTSAASTPFTVNWTIPSNARTLSVKAPNFVDAAIAWGAPANTGGLIDHYNVEVSNDNAVTWTALATNITATKLSAPGSCTSGVVCKYRVWARNAVGIATTPSSVVSVNVAPSRPTSWLVSHSADDVTTGNTTSGSGTMTLTWNAPTTGLHDGPYELQECTGACVVTSTLWSAIELIPNNTLTATRTCPAGAVTCTYRVRATNLRGGLSALTQTRYAPGAAPLTNVSTGSTSGTVNATFNAVTGSGPAILTAHFQFWVCRTGCATAANWSLSPTTVKYPPTTVPTVAAVACPASGASCSVRVQFVNDSGATSMLSNAGSATAG